MNPLRIKFLPKNVPIADPLFRKQINLLSIYNPFFSAVNSLFIHHAIFKALKKAAFYAAFLIYMTQ
jgi:hypothetical protein